MGGLSLARSTGIFQDMASPVVSLAGIALLAFGATAAEAAYDGRYGPPRASWADSYSANGSCWIASTFDHGAGDLIVSTPAGLRTVREVRAAIGPGPGAAGNPRYNDVQCGNGPANDRGDEDPGQCPGRVDRGAAGCMTIGPRWDLSAFERRDTPPPAAPTGGGSSSEGGRCAADAATLPAARARYAERCSAPRRDCDPLVGGGWRCASYALSGPQRASAEPAPARPAPPPSAPVPAPPAQTPSSPVAPSSDALACSASAPTLSGARAAFAAQCSRPRVDCDPAGGGWTCASYRIDGNGPGRPSAPSAPAAPGPATPTAGANLRVEAELGTAEGWEIGGSSITWRGPNRFALSRRRDDANIAYSIRIPEAGRYRVVMRARARIVTDPSEPPNDMWVTYGSVPWTKVFFPKRTKGFTTQTIGDRGPGARGTGMLVTRLPAGPTTVTISGRSQGFELDWIELQRVD